jgi:hypothetical protein
LAEESEGGLDGGDISDGEVIIGSKEVRGWFEKEANLEVGLMAGGDSTEGVARLKVEAVGERAGEGDGVGFGNEGDGIGRGAKGVFEAVGHEFTIREGIDADEMKEFSGVIGEGSDKRECGSDFTDSGIVPKKRDQFLGEAEALAFNCEVGPTSDEVERCAERAKGGFVDGLNCDDGGDPDGESEEVEERESFMAEKIAPPMREENAESGEPVQDQDWMRPSTRRMRRSALVAISSLWVTSTTVVFSRRASWVMRSMTMVLEVESRLPVGSSARRVEGWWIRARARAARWSWPPES